MHTSVLAATTFAAASLAASGVFADAAAVKLPQNYQAEFVNYLDVDHHDRSRVRKMYVNSPALKAAVAGEPLPDGTILIMEDHDPVLADDGTPAFEDGRMVAQNPVTNIFVMEKNPAWSTDNGNWDYAWYQPDGTPRPDVDYSGCFACHAYRSERDYTFTFWTFVSDQAE